MCVCNHHHHHHIMMLAICMLCSCINIILGSFLFVCVCVPMLGEKMQM